MPFTVKITKERQVAKDLDEKSSCARVILRWPGGDYLRNESTLHLPEPIAAKYKKTKQYNAASSPPF